MENVKYKLKGHGSFYIREGWLQKGLKKFQAEGPDLFSKREANEILGVGANMVSAIKYWLISTGLLEYSNDKKLYVLAHWEKKYANMIRILRTILHFGYFIIILQLTRNIVHYGTYFLIK